MSSILKKAAVVSIPNVRQALLRSNPVLATSLLAKRAYNSKNGVEVTHPTTHTLLLSLSLSLSLYHTHVHTNTPTTTAAHIMQEHHSLISSLPWLGFFISSFFLSNYYFFI
jgi:hypothetical protein